VYVVEEKSATSSKGVRFPIFLVLKLHVSMRTNKKHHPPCYILHLQWIRIPFEEVLICTLLSPIGYKKRTGQFLRALHVYSIYNFVAF
jgi:hypothetical protein